MGLTTSQVHHNLKRYWVTNLFLLALTLLGFIPIRLAIASYQTPHPQAIFALGGDPKREAAAAQLAKYCPELEIWISSGELPNKARAIFQAAGVSDRRLHLDYRASDTVTNFTTLVSEFKQHHIQHLYLVTSDVHMPRAEAIATIVLGSQGITFTPVSVPSARPKEAGWRILRDSGRSLLWIMTGHTGASLRQISKVGE